VRPAHDVVLDVEKATIVALFALPPNGAVEDETPRRQEMLDEIFQPFLVVVELLAAVPLISASFARTTAANLPASAVAPPVSGCNSRAKRRNALLIAASSAP
jgi:hypothetical protein